MAKLRATLLASLHRHSSSIVAVVLQLAGLISIVAGVWWIYPPAAMILGGVAFLLVGQAVAAGPPRSDRP